MTKTTTTVKKQAYTTLDPSIFDDSYSIANKGTLTGTLVKIAPEKNNSKIVNVAVTTYNSYTKKNTMHFLKASDEGTSKRPNATKLLNATKGDHVDLDVKMVSHYVDTKNGKRNIMEMHVVNVEVLG